MYADHADGRGACAPAELSVEEPEAGHVARAGRTLGLNEKLEEDEPPPKFWFETEGRALVPKTEWKEELLKQIARRL